MPLLNGLTNNRRCMQVTVALSPKFLKVFAQESMDKSRDGRPDESTIPSKNKILLSEVLQNIGWMSQVLYYLKAASSWNKLSSKHGP